MIDLNHHSGYVPGKQAPIVELINAAIDLGALRRKATEPRRTYVGASIVGDPCNRKLFYEWFDVPVDVPLAGRTVRYWDAGTLFETLATQWFREATFELRTHGQDGNQFGFMTAQGRIGGHIDGVLMNGPVALPYPLGWEHKALNEKSWSDCVKRKVKASKPIYYAQMQTYMAYLELEHFLFSITNKNTQELWHELVPFDRQEAQRVSDKTVDLLRAIDARTLPPRIASRPDYYLCRWCSRNKRCWEVDPA
jgi:hypothetical protein